MALVKIKPFAFGGILLIVIGIGTIVRRNIVMPAHREESNTGDQKIITETTRIVRVPLPASIISDCCRVRDVVSQHTESVAASWKHSLNSSGWALARTRCGSAGSNTAKDLLP